MIQDEFGVTADAWFDVGCVYVLQAVTTGGEHPAHRVVDGLPWGYRVLSCQVIPEKNIRVYLAYSGPDKTPPRLGRVDIAFQQLPVVDYSDVVVEAVAVTDEDGNYSVVGTSAMSEEEAEGHALRDLDGGTSYRRKTVIRARVPLPPKADAVEAEVLGG